MDASLRGKIEGGKTAQGSAALSYSELMAVFDFARAHALVIANVESHKPVGVIRYARADATFHFLRSAYGPDRQTNVENSLRYAELVLSGVEDRDKLVYVVWFDTE